jgi:hypothetical protein
MKITAVNFIPLLTDIVNELTLITARLQEIQQDTPDTHEELLLINGRFAKATEHLPGVIEYIGREKPPPALVGDRLKDAITLVTETLKEKTRIIEATPRIIYETNDDTGLN